MHDEIAIKFLYGLLLLLDGELELDVLAGQVSVDRRESVELVLEQVGVLGVEETEGAREDDRSMRKGEGRGGVSMDVLMS